MHASCSPPRRRCTATPSCTHSPSTTGETSIPSVPGVYDEAKRFSEALTTAYRATHNLDTGIVRIFNTYGPRMRPDDGRAIPTFMGQALRGEPITVAGDGSQTRSICFVDDTVEGILAMANSSHAGPINLGNPDEMTMLELAERIRRLTASSSSIEFVDLPTDDPRVRCPDASLARELLGWTPRVSSDEGLERTLEWFSTLAATNGPAA
ncbi:MAG: NAD-dependent epimerase/dehydratase family protein [Nocardioidaceae bacterium]